MMGEKCSAETLAKMSKAMTCKELSARTCAKISETMTGRELSAKTCDNMSEAKMDKKISAETCAKMSEAKKGKKLSAKTCAKISKAKKGKQWSVETCAKISCYQIISTISVSSSVWGTCNSHLSRKLQNMILGTFSPTNALESFAAHQGFLVLVTQSLAPIDDFPSLQRFLLANNGVSEYQTTTNCQKKTDPNHQSCMKRRHQFCCHDCTDHSTLGVTFFLT